MRQEAILRADQALDAFLNCCFAVDEENDCGEILGEFFWTRAEIFEIAIDAYEKTGEERHHDLMGQMYRGFIKGQGEEWSHNVYNDDIMWMTIACSRAYQLTGEAYYREQVEHHFNLVFERAWSEDLGGGLFWRTDNTCKNACINGPAVIAGCLLYQITGDDSYLDRAGRIYEWQVDTLFGEDGAVYDNIDMNGECNTWCSTYNQGTFIGASHLLYQITGEQAYMDRAVRAADYTMEVMFENGVINTEAEGNDLPGFKGILARWLGKLVSEGGQEQYHDWLLLNAESAWNNQNEKGVMWTLWGEKTGERSYMPWGCSAAVALLYAVIG